MLEEKHSVIWNDCLRIMENILEPQQFSTWFKPIRPVSLDGSSLTVEVPNHFFCEYIEANFVDLLGKTLRRVLGANAKLFYKVHVVASQDPMKLPLNEVQQPVNPVVTVPVSYTEEGAGSFYSMPGMPGVQRLHINPQLNTEYNFDNLVQGPCNNLAVTAGKIIAQDPGKTYNPLFLFGGPGLGKTHVAQAIGLQIKKNLPEKTVLYIPANRFKSQFVKVMSSPKNQLPDFLAFYQKIDVLIIDDIQEFETPGVQNAFFHIFNHLHQNGKQLILTSDRPQVDFHNFEQRLISRLKWGLSAQLEAPDYNTRMAMLRLRALREGTTVPENVLEYLANNIKSNFRELEGALISMIAHATFEHKDITIDLAKKVTEIIVDVAQSEITIDNVQKAVCDYFNITFDEFLSPSRKRQIVQARQIAMYLSRNLTSSSLSTIGEQIGGKNHATVLHSCSTVSDLMATDRVFKQYVVDIQKSLTN